MRVWAFQWERERERQQERVEEFGIERRSKSVTYQGGPPSAWLSLYLSFSSLVTRLVMRPHSRPMRKSTQTARAITNMM